MLVTTKTPSTLPPVTFTLTLTVEEAVVLGAVLGANSVERCLSILDRNRALTEAARSAARAWMNTRPTPTYHSLYKPLIEALHEHGLAVRGM